MRASDLRREMAATLAAYQPTRLVHVGGHEGEELYAYLAAGIRNITVVEPLPVLAGRLRMRFPTVEVVQAACSDRAGVAALHVPARTNMASLHDVGGTSVNVPTVRLDAVCPDADAAVVDVQGHEMEVLAAAPWESLRVVVVETLHGVDDPGLSPPYGAMVTYMAGRGFAERQRWVRDYDWIMRWAYGRTTRTGAEVRDVVFAKADR